MAYCGVTTPDGLRCGSHRLGARAFPIPLDSGRWRPYSFVMKNGLEEQEQEWVAAWRRAGQAMEALRRKALRELSEEESVRLFNALDCAPPAPLPKTSGLVEQQRLFALPGRSV